MNEPLITIDSQIVSGTPVFYGTRVPIKNLIDYLIEGDTIDAFLESFPTVNREQVIRFLELTEAAMIAYTYENSAR